MNTLRPTPTSGEELEKLRRDLDLNQQQMGRLLGVSREWISRIESGGAPISEFMRLKLVALLERDAHSVNIVAEAQAPYLRDPRLAKIPSSPDLARGGPMERQVLLNPSFAPRPPEPTPQACIDYFLTYLKAAEHAPGGVGVLWWKLQKNFPLDEFDPAQK